MVESPFLSFSPAITGPAQLPWWGKAPRVQPQGPQHLPSSLRFPQSSFSPLLDWWLRRLSINDMAKATQLDHHEQSRALHPSPMSSSFFPQPQSVIPFDKYRYLQLKDSSWGDWIRVSICLGGSAVKNPPADAGNAGSIPELGRSPGGGNGNLLQYSCLENHMDRGAWRDSVHGVARVGHSSATKQHRSDEWLKLSWDLSAFYFAT